MAQTNVQAFSGDVEISSNLAVSGSKFTYDNTNTTVFTGNSTANDNEIGYLDMSTASDTNNIHVKIYIKHGQGTVMGEAEYSFYTRANAANASLIYDYRNQRGPITPVVYRTNASDLYSGGTGGVVRFGYSIPGGQNIFWRAEVSQRINNTTFYPTNTGSAVVTTDLVQVTPAPFTRFDSNVAVGTNKLFVDSVGGTVGIGSTLIDITDPVISGAGNGLYIHNPVQRGHLLTLGTQRPWVFEQGGADAVTQLNLRSLNSGKKFNIQSPDETDVMTVVATNGGGKVGIGTNDPQYTLDVNGTIGQNGKELYPQRRWEINLTAQSNTIFYPIEFKHPLAEGNPDLPDMYPVHFKIFGESLSGSDSFNENTLIGYARGGGYSDHNPLYDVHVNRFTADEHRFQGLYEGTGNYQDYIVIYMRGGYRYSALTDAADVVTRTTSFTSGTSTFALKNTGGTDVSGTSANIAQLVNIADVELSEQRWVSGGLRVSGRLSTQNGNGETPAVLFRSGANDTNSWDMAANISDSFAGDFTIDRLDAATKKKFVIKNNGRIGIGTNAPDGNLHISSGTSGNCVLILEADTDNNNENDNPSIEFRQDGGIAESAIMQKDNYLDFKNSVTTLSGIRFFTGGVTSGYTNAIERMHIDEIGRVGIGTDNPECMLQLSAGTASSDITDPIKLKIHNRRGAGDWSTTQPWGLLEFDTSDTSGSGDGPVAGVGCRFESAGGGSASLCFYTDHDNNNNNVLGPANERMCIDHDGRVGIGTTNPVESLNIAKSRNTQVIIEDIGTDNGTYFPSLIVRSPGTTRGSSLTDGVVLLGVAHDSNSGGNNYNRLGWDGAYADRLYLMRLAGYNNYGSGDTTVGFLAGTGSETAINFTGQHRTFIKDTPFVRAEELEGLIVSSDQNKYIKMSGGIEAGSNAITINESLPIVSISTKVKDKKCFGVISSSEDPDSREDTVGIFTSVLEKEKGDTRVYINSVGEGAIWVTNINGSLESGDYITTSNVAGYGQKQDSEFLANYTVAKITMDCDFDPVTQPVQIIRKELSNVNYWVNVRYNNVSEEEYLDLVEENRRFVNDKYQKITKEESKTEREGWELEVRQELVNVLDEHGQIQWEDDPSGTTEKAYKIRYLDVSGAQTDSTNAVHIAAFVGCTYHCG